MVITILCMAWFFYRLRKQAERSYETYMLLAYLSSLTLAYSLKIIYILGINTGEFTPSDCKYICTPMYFFLLSAFCWPLALTFNLLTSIRNYRLQNEVENKLDIITFLRFSKFAWSLPLLLTVIALALYKSDLSIWLVEKPPFDDCFDNEEQTMLYLYASISTLILMDSLLFLIYSYDMWVTRGDLRENSRLEKNKLTAHRSFISRKFIDILMLIILLQFIPDVPIILCIVVYIYCTMTWHILIVVSFYEKTLFVNFYNSMFQAKDDKIATISNKDVEEGNNKAIVSSSSVENSLTMLLIWIWQQKNKISNTAKLDEEDTENCEDADNIRNYDVEK